MTMDMTKTITTTTTTTKLIHSQTATQLQLQLQIKLIVNSIHRNFNSPFKFHVILSSLSLFFICFCLFFGGVGMCVYVYVYICAFLLYVMHVRESYFLVCRRIKSLYSPLFTTS